MIYFICSTSSDHMNKNTIQFMIMDIQYRDCLENHFLDDNQTYRYILRNIGSLDKVLGQDSYMLVDMDLHRDYIVHCPHIGMTMMMMMLLLLLLMMLNRSMKI